MITELFYDDALAITTSDAAAQLKGKGCAGFVVSVAGLVNLVTATGTTLTVPAAAGIPVRLAGVKWFKTASTTATGIVALFDAAHPKVT